jgi:VIT1/CCC1 family predicted Fe2+/Mn2+ transporter
VALSIHRHDYDHHTEQVHAAGGPWVRDVMLGLNDGLVASFAVTSGVAGAFTHGNAAVMAGLSEMLGGAVAMGLAAFISARSQVEFYQSEIEREREEIKRWPDRERDEIRTIYREKGFGGQLLEQIVAHITADPERWSNVMMREELGFSEGSFDSPLRSAFAVGLSYLCGAFVPVWAYIFFEPSDGITVSAISTIVVLFAVGALKTVITSRSWWRSGLESMLTGIAAAGVTYAAGRFFATRQ